MKLLLRSITTHLTRHPTYLFLLDGLGAFATGGVLFGVARYGQASFGMPAALLRLLAGIALVFMVYSMTCYVVRPRNTRLFLRVIAVANLGYCGLTLLLVVRHMPGLTMWGFTYFLSEAVVIASLVYLELVVAARQGR